MTAAGMGWQARKQCYMVQKESLVVEDFKPVG